MGFVECHAVYRAIYKACMRADSEHQIEWKLWADIFHLPGWLVDTFEFSVLLLLDFFLFVFPSFKNVISVYSFNQFLFIVLLCTVCISKHCTFFIY